MTADMPMGMPADIGLQAAGLEPGSAVALGIDGAIAQGAVVGARAGAIGWELIAWSPAGPPAAGVLHGRVTELNGGSLLVAPADHDNLVALRALLPWLRPRRLTAATSFGFGDRLGLATQGHVAALRAQPGVQSVLAQQSARELARTGRTFREVVDAATIGALAAGWREGFGADGDHLKTITDLEAALDAGCSQVTADPIEVVPRIPADGPADELDAAYVAVPWTDLEDDPASFRRRYPERLHLDSGTLELPRTALRAAAARFAPAVVRVTDMHRRLREVAGDAVGFEVAVDEIAFATTPVDHVYLATELRRRGVRWEAFAPRFVGQFEKGVDYLGDPLAFGRDIALHAAIARTLGEYRLSIHSGSDKFSVYAAIVEGTGGRFHLKTSGTSYLEALRTVARADPSLMREIWRLARAEYAVGRASYWVSAEPDGTPGAANLADGELVRLLDAADSREILHVTYGTVWASLGAELRRAVWLGRDAYNDALVAHLGRHLAALSRKG
jgi:hypothetical protein